MWGVNMVGSVVAAWCTPYRPVRPGGASKNAAGGPLLAPKCPWAWRVWQKRRHLAVDGWTRIRL